MKSLKNLISLACLLIPSVLWAQLEIGKTYRIVPVDGPSFSLFITNSSKDVNTAVTLWAETNVPAQQWIVGTAGTSSFTLKNAYSNLFLGLKSNTRGGTLQMVSSATSGRWRLEPEDEQALIYRMRPMSGSNYLTYTNTVNGSAPALNAAAEGNRQLWRFVEVSEPVTAFDANVRDEMIDQYIKRFCQQKGTGFRTFSNGGWGESEQLEVIIDAYENTGNPAYFSLAQDMYNWFYDRVGDNWNGGSKGNYAWFGYDFNDDVMWQIIAASRLAWITGDTKYRTAAKRNFDLIYQRAYMPEWGMMRWAENSGDRNGTNSCIMGPTEVAACYLGMSGCGEKYFEIARDLYAKQRQYLANISTGQVYDSFVWDPNTGGVAYDEKGQERFNRWASTYNQGTMLGAAVLLYDHYGDKMYSDDAKMIMRYSDTDLCDKSHVVRVCQTNDGDLCGFKGILMRYVRRFVLDLNQPQYKSWLTTNAYHAYNNRAENGVTTSAWLTKSTQEVATSTFSCSCAASAAANAVLHDLGRSAYEDIQAEEFDYHQALTRTETVLTGIKESRWAIYTNIDFGSEPAKSILVYVSPFTWSGTGTIEVRLDNIDSDPIGQLEFTSAEDWRNVVADITPTTGTHTVYLTYRFSTRSRPNPYQVDWFRFSTQTAQEVEVGVKSISQTPVQNSSATYDISGRRVADHPEKPGIYVRNGRRFVVR